MKFVTPGIIIRTGRRFARKESTMAALVRDDIRKKLADSKQLHVLKFLDEGKLSKEQEKLLVDQLQKLDFDFIESVYRSTINAPPVTDEKISPFPSEASMTISEVKKKSSLWKDNAYSLVSENKVCFVTLAGGQGTRLGFDGPKGMYNISLPSQKTLFHLFAERLLSLQNKAKEQNSLADTPVIPWYIMTSPLNHEETKTYFEKNNYFGLDASNVFLFSQGTLPCFTLDGKFIMENPYTIATAPDGNGGIYSSLKMSGGFEDMRKRGIKWVHVCSVDNSLTQVADPVFIGCCEAQNADVGNLSCPKKAWNEKVGVVALKGGMCHIVEYSEISEEMAKEKDSTGLLLYRAGNICNHLFSLDFLLNQALGALNDSYHIARKKIPHVDEATLKTVKPTEVNGLKLEMFIFDVFPLSKSMTVVECERETNFAPVKNAPSTDGTIAPDSPQSARAMIFQMCFNWLRAANAELVGESDICEVTPLVSSDGSDLEKHVSGCTLQTPLLVACKADLSEESLVKLEGAEKVSGSPTLKHFVNEEDVNVYIIN